MISVVKNNGQVIYDDRLHEYPHCNIDGIDRSQNGAILRVIYRKSERKLKVEMMINHINQDCVEVHDIDIPTFYMGVSATNGNSINDYRVQSLFYDPIGEQPYTQNNNNWNNNYDNNQQQNTNEQNNNYDNQNRGDLSDEEFQQLQQHKKERIKEELFYIYNAIGPVKNGLHDLAQVKRDDSLRYTLDDIIVDEDNEAKKKLKSIIDELELSAVSGNMNTVKSELNKIGDIYGGLQYISNTYPIIIAVALLGVSAYFAFALSKVKKSNHVE